MTWPGTKTWAIADVLTAADLNTYVRDALKYVATDSPRCEAYENVAQNVTTATNTALTMTSERYDNASIHSTSSNTSRFTIPETGLYELNGNVSWDNNNTNGRLIFWRANGTTQLPGANFKAAYGTSDAQSVIDYPLTAGAYVELIAFQDSGTTRQILVDCTVRWIGT